MTKEFNSRRIFPVHQHGGHSIVLYTNMAAVTSCENNLYSKAMKPQTSSRPLGTLDIEAGFTLQHAKKVVQAWRIHTGFHRFTEIGQIFHYNYILSKKPLNFPS